jgi:hypothetical protein
MFSKRLEQLLAHGTVKYRYAKHKKQDTVMRKAITPNERLTVTLRFLATGRTLEHFKFSTRISPQALGRLNHSSPLTNSVTHQKITH